MGRKYQTWRRIPLNDPTRAIPVIVDALRELSDDPTPGAVTKAELAAAVKSSSTTSSTGSTIPDSYTHTQTIAESSWSVAHNLLRYPSVVIVDSGGTTLWAEVAYVDANNLTITFSQPVSGSAYCN